MHSLRHENPSKGFSPGNSVCLSIASRGQWIRSFGPAPDNLVDCFFHVDERPVHDDIRVGYLP